MVDSFDILQPDAQPTNPTQSISDFAYNNNAGRWTSVSSGRFVPTNDVVNQMRLHTAGTFSTLDSLTNQLYDGSITVQQWQLSVASELKDAHLAQAMFGAGGRRNMTSVEFGRVGGTLRSEYGFLDGFAQDIANGNQSRAQSLARIRQYGRASQQSYWQEHRQSISNRNNLVSWVLGIAEHCPDCSALADSSPHNPLELSIVPGSGGTRCRGNCNCTLEEVRHGR